MLERRPVELNRTLENVLFMQRWHCTNVEKTMDALINVAGSTECLCGKQKTLMPTHTKNKSKKIKIKTLNRLWT